MWNLDKWPQFFKNHSKFGQNIPILNGLDYGYSPTHENRIIRNKIFKKSGFQIPTVMENTQIQGFFIRVYINFLADTIRLYI